MVKLLKIKRRSVKRDQGNVDANPQLLLEAWNMYPPLCGLKSIGYQRLLPIKNSLGIRKSKPLVLYSPATKVTS